MQYIISLHIPANREELLALRTSGQVHFLQFAQADVKQSSQAIPCEESASSVTHITLSERGFLPVCKGFWRTRRGS